MAEKQITRAILLAGIVVACAALSGCASLDNAMFGGPGQAATEPSTVPESDDSNADNGTETAAAPAPAAPAPAEAQTAEAQTEAAPPPAEAAPPAEGESAGTLPESGEPPPAAASAAAPTLAVPAVPPVGLGAVTIVPGADTGTTVGHTVAGIRAGLQEVAGQMMTSGQQLATLRRSSAQQLTAYHQAAAQIATQLQIGTTRANPQLVAQWNAAQAALDQLTANLNALNTVGAQIGGEASRAHTLLDQIHATYDVAGAVDEDHRQLSVLEDETNQTLVVLDRLQRDAAADLRRQTASLSRERGNLTQLADAIKQGDLYGGGGRVAGTSALASPPAAVPLGTGAPVVTIRFARTNVNYEKKLYAALNQALQARPGASFDVVGVSPTRGTAQAVQTAQNDARRHAQDVMHTMTEMGVPATRMDLSSATDPGIRTSEVRVILR